LATSHFSQDMHKPALNITLPSWHDGILLINVLSIIARIKMTDASTVKTEEWQWPRSGDGQIAVSVSQKKYEASSTATCTMQCYYTLLMPERTQIQNQRNKNCYYIFHSHFITLSRYT
jgi:hypothetical protein